MTKKKKNTAQKSLLLCSLFESEILVLLLLRNWEHPLSEDADFRSSLLETATEVLLAASRHGQVFIEGVPPEDMNLIAALWYVENCALEHPETMTEREEHARRTDWLTQVRRSLPSCFCAQEDLMN